MRTYNPQASVAIYLNDNIYNDSPTMRFWLVAIVSHLCHNG
jgi:hypothetical protein